LALDALVDGRQAPAEALPDPVTQQEAREEKSRGGAQGRREGDDHGPPQHPEDGATCQRQQGRPGYRQCRDEHIDDEVEGDTRDRVVVTIVRNGGLLRLERLQVEVLAEIEQEEAADRGGEDY